MIVDGLLAPGSEVPSTRELSTQLHVARNTVVRAYEGRAGRTLPEMRLPLPGDGGNAGKQRGIQGRASVPGETGELM
jgi:DNA-binding transcriptional MocR family regulator